MSTISFKRIPIYVSDPSSKYFIVDLLLPLPFNEEHIKLLIQFVTAMCNGLSTTNNIDIAMANLYDRLPFSMFNYLYIPNPQSDTEKIDRIIEGNRELYINQTKIPISMKDVSQVDLCMIIMKNYIN